MLIALLVSAVTFAGDDFDSLPTAGRAAWIKNHLHGDAKALRDLVGALGSSFSQDFDNMQKSSAVHPVLKAVLPFVDDPVAMWDHLMGIQDLDAAGTFDLSSDPNLAEDNVRGAAEVIINRILDSVRKARAAHDEADAIGAKLPETKAKQNLLLTANNDLGVGLTQANADLSLLATQRADLTNEYNRALAELGDKTAAASARKDQLIAQLKDNDDQLVQTQQEVRAQESRFETLGIAYENSANEGKAAGAELDAAVDLNKYTGLAFKPGGTAAPAVPFSSKRPAVFGRKIVAPR